MSGRGEMVDHRPAAGVGLERAGIADGDDGAADVLGALLFVLLMNWNHGVIPRNYIA